MKLSKSQLFKLFYLVIISVHVETIFAQKKVDLWDNLKLNEIHVGLSHADVNTRLINQYTIIEKKTYSYDYGISHTILQIYYIDDLFILNIFIEGEFVRHMNLLYEDISNFLLPIEIIGKDLDSNWYYSFIQKNEMCGVDSLDFTTCRQSFFDHNSFGIYEIDNYNKRYKSLLEKIKIGDKNSLLLDFTSCNPVTKLYGLLGLIVINADFNPEKVCPNYHYALLNSNFEVGYQKYYEKFETVKFNDVYRELILNRTKYKETLFKAAFD